jgi:hypothetical protein
MVRPRAAWLAAFRGEGVERLLHRIERLARAGKNAVLEESREPGVDRAIVMRFCVRVPVLSVQSTVATPRVSTQRPGG